jgi:hypothetical protein
MYRYNGALGGGAAANELETSAPTAIRPSLETMAQNNRLLAASKEFANVCPRVTVFDVVTHYTPCKLS